MLHPLPLHLPVFVFLWVLFPHRFCCHRPCGARRPRLTHLYWRALHQERLPSVSCQCALGSALPVSVVLFPAPPVQTPSMIPPSAESDSWSREFCWAPSAQPSPALRKALSHACLRIMAGGVGVGKPRESECRRLQTAGSGVQNLSPSAGVHSSCRGGSMGTPDSGTSSLPPKAVVVSKHREILENPFLDFPLEERKGLTHQPSSPKQVIRRAQNPSSCPSKRC